MKNFWFMLQEIDPCIFAVVINDCQKTFVLGMRNNKTNTLNITMNDLKIIGGSISFRRKELGFTFAKFTSCTIRKHNGRRILFIIQ
jgi:hypothetical protein